MGIQSILPFLTQAYAAQIYISGTNRLTARDGYKGVPTAYYIPVEQYAAAHYILTDIDYALSQGYISQTEYDETVGYMA